MARELIKRFIPDPHTIKDHHILRHLGTRLHDPSLWHLNRRSASWAMFIGLFWAFVPMPVQMSGAAVTALIFRKNIPLSVALVWLTNPLTMAPTVYVNYTLGSWALGVDPKIHNFEWSWEWVDSLTSSMNQMLAPFIVGCFMTGVISGILGFILLRFYWRYHIISRYRARQLARKEKLKIQTMD